MENDSASWLDKPAVRLSLMVLVVIMLNFGLFFLLNFLAPLVTGLIIGFLIGKFRDSVAVSLLGTVLSYCIVFLFSEWFLGFASDPVDVLVAVLIMGAIGAAGGLVGFLISMRIRP